MGTHPIFESDFDCLTDEMEQLINYGVALEDEKNVRFGLSGQVQQIIAKRDNFEAEIPEEVKYRIRDLNNLIENKIIEVEHGVDSDRRAFAKLFASTGSDVGLTQSASESIIVKARGWINQVATGLKGAKSVTHRNGVAAWGVPLLTNCKKLLSDAVKSPSSTTTISNSVQLPEDVDLMILEVENLIQSMIKDQLDDFTYTDSLENETRSLYHQLGQSAPV